MSDTRIDCTATDSKRQENLTSLFTTALEGGIGYWSCAYVYRWNCPWGERHALLGPVEEEEVTDWVDAGVEVEEYAFRDGSTALLAKLTPEGMGTGLRKLAAACPGRRNQCGSTFAAMSRLLGSDDFPDFDSCDADTVAQWALGLVSTRADGTQCEIYG